MGRVMITGTSSGCGKTTIVCAILQALVNSGIKTVSFKCGPDYIDPMFHSKIIGTKSRNLDGYFLDKAKLNYLIHKNSKDMEIAVIEGVMGYYDGLDMNSTKASSYSVAIDTNTPVVIVIPCKGMSRSAQAMLSGYLNFIKPSNIKGVIFNQLPKSLYPAMKEYCESIGIKALGYFPNVSGARIESRHLGLITADEIDDLKEKMNLLAKTARECLDLEGLIELANQAEPIDEKYYSITTPEYIQSKDTLRIGVAMDRAFCFYYEDNLDFLRELNCEIVPFSPVNDSNLPENLDGLIFGGGYPEIYLEQLSNNSLMRQQIKEAIQSGIPTHAECGGFMYMHEYIKSPEGKLYAMVGMVPGECFYTEKLQRFGYVELTAQTNSVLADKGEKIRAHEFHRYESLVEQHIFSAQKRDKKWECGYLQYNLAAGFPHIHYYANLNFAIHFYEKIRLFHDEKSERRM